jgi:hypothetical protein
MLLARRNQQRIAAEALARTRRASPVRSRTLAVVDLLQTIARSAARAGLRW